MHPVISRSAFLSSGAIVHGRQDSKRDKGFSFSSFSIFGRRGEGRRYSSTRRATLRAAILGWQGHGFSEGAEALVNDVYQCKTGSSYFSKMDKKITNVHSDPGYYLICSCT